MAAPALYRLKRLLTVNRRHYYLAVKLYKSSVLELGTRMGDSPGAHRFKKFISRQSVNKLMQMTLNRLGGLL